LEAVAVGATAAALPWPTLKPMDGLAISMRRFLLALPAQQYKKAIDHLVLNGVE
jgi:hypothetical protein